MDSQVIRQMDSQVDLTETSPQTRMKSVIKKPKKRAGEERGETRVSEEENDRMIDCGKEECFSAF